MTYRSDPTANQALGNISREWNRMARLAERIRRDPYSDWAMQQRRCFTGIYRCLLDEALGQSGSRAS